MHMPYGRRGGEIVVNKQLVGSQFWPSIAGFDSGGFIVVWTTTDTLQDGAGFAIKAQRFDSLGNAVGSEMLVNSSSAGDQRAPSVTTLASGGYVVTWETTDSTQDGSGRAIKGQLFDSAGVPVGAEFRINTQGNTDQTNSSVTGLAGGGFVVTWETADPTADGHSSAIKGQIYSAAGTAVGGEFLVNTGAFGNEANPDVTSLSGGGFVATWTRGSGTDGDIYAQVFGANGAKLGGQFLVSTTSTLNQSFASISEISGGRFVVTWQSSASLTTMDTEIRARIFSANGTPLGNDFLVNTSRTFPDNGFLLGPSAPSVADLPGGGFVITWAPSSGSAPGSSVFAQYFDSNGNRAGTEVLVNTVTNRFESDVEVAVDGNGNVFVLWGSYNQNFQDSDIHGQVYSASGAPEILSNGGGDIASATAAENQNAVTTVSAVDPDSSGSLVYSIVAGADASRFAINASTGALTFVSTPNFESRIDSNGNGIYEVVVSVSDGVMSDIQTLFVTVTNVNEAPTISSSNPSDYFHRENGTAVATFSATDPDGTAVTWSIAGGADAARFAIDPVTGALRFVEAPDFEAPADVGANNFYNVIISASDGSLFATRALTIEIANLNEGPVIVSGGGGDTASVSVAENSSLVTTVVADDPDFQNSSFSFSIAGGADAALFTIQAQTGQLFFKSGLGANFEAPTDAGGNNVYDVIVSVSDGFSPADTQAIAITVTDANDAPVITSNGGGASASLSMPENQLAVATIAATDADNATLNYGIAGGADAALFAIDAQTGLLSFLSAPDREAPGDAGANNVYNVTVSVSDGAKSDTQALSITVLNSEEAPVISSNGGGGTAAISVAENQFAVTTVAASDPEGKALSYAISGGADASWFAINSVTGALSFVAAPDHEQPADSGGNNVYDVVVSASDGTFSDTQALSITVGNVNEGVAITSGASASAEENGTAVMTVTAQDLDGDSVSFAISGGADSALFAVDSATGELRFLAAPNFEAPADADGDNVYQVEVSASDGSLSTSKSLSVTVTNENEAIAFVSGGGGDQASVTIAENSGNVMALLAVDPEGATPLYGIAGGADAALFMLDPVTKALRFKALPNFEAPGDADGDNVYEVVVGTTDGQTFDYQTISVTVANFYEGISFGASEIELSAEENSSQVGVVAAVSGDGNPLSYTITGGEDSPLFSIDPATGALSFIEAPDFEAPPGGHHEYRVRVTASDPVFGTSSSVYVTVVLGNVDEGVVLTSYEGDESVALSLAENGAQVGQVEAWDLDGGQVSYAIVGGADAARFAIDSSTGILSFASGALPDFEAPADSGGDNVYDVTVAATAGADSVTQAFAVTIVNANDGIFITSNGGYNSVGLTFDEGVSQVTTVVANDPDGATPVYSITGGNDASFFTIDSATGVLRFIEAPDYETPLDSYATNIYVVIVTASDGEMSSSQYLSVLIRNVNEAVTITSSGGADSVAVTIAEDRTVVANVDAVDADGGPVHYSIAGGADSAFFGIDPLSGELHILDADYDSPADADGDNVYEVIVAADDGWLSDSQAFSVTIADVDEPLFFTSYNGDFNVSLAVDENSRDAAVVAAEDPEGAAIVYSIVDSYDGASFTIDAQTGVLRFLTAPDHESPADLDGNNVYTVLVAATDGRFFDYQTISIQVEDVNDRPSVTTGPALSVNEDSAYVARVAATDGDGDTLSFAIVGGADASHFVIDPETGDLSIVASLDYEAPADADGDNVYEVIVQASDGQSSDERQLSITVNDVFDDVEIVSYGGADQVALTVQEGSLQVADADASFSPFWGARFAIAGGADAALFAVDPYSGLLSFKYPFLPDFEAAADAGGDNVYDVVVVVTMATSSDTQAFAITVDNRNEGLWITSNGGGDAAVSISEGDRNVTTVVAYDQDGDAPIYSIVGGADSALFAIDPATGALTFIAAPDYEAPHGAAGTNSYVVEVGASDGEYSSRQTITVGVGNVNEGVTITSGGGGASDSVTVAENGTAVTTVAAGDVDGDALTYAIAGGADSSRFAIDPQTGALRFVQAPNFEAPGDVGGNNVYDVVVSVTDGSFTDSQAVAVTVSNLNEALAITSNGGGASASISVAENGAAVATVAASDPDGGAVTYAIAGGADAARFTINASTGALAFVAAPNFEAPGDVGANNVYDVVVSASDGSFVDTQALAVTVGNVNEAVVITSSGGGASATATAAENGTAVLTVSAGDPDGGPVTYAIAGGADSGRFTIDAATGYLAFLAAPNFEAPADSGANNVYDVVVSASDGTSTDTQALAVSVGNVNEAPVIMSNGGSGAAAISVAENGLAVTMVTAADPDGTLASYSIVGGADAARFTINPQTGALQFVAAPDWELPGDSNQDNVYAVVVRASDGQLVDDQALSVSVTNMRDGNNVTGTSAGDSISATSTNVALRTSNAEDVVFGRDGHDNIQGMAGDDELSGEAGNDVLIGGAGADRLSGGLGKDEFTYNAVSESTGASRDLILDFSKAQADKISLSAIDANSVLSANQAFTFIGTSAFSNAPGQLRYEISGGFTTVFGDVNGDGIADLQIQLSGSIVLAASDFVL
jgi:hypothetical protein